MWMKIESLSLTLFCFAEESLFLEPRFEDQDRAKDDEQDRAVQVSFKDHFTEATDESEDSEKCGEAAHLKFVEVTRGVQT
jgi:hypothetical protein